MSEGGTSYLRCTGSRGSVRAEQLAGSLEAENGDHCYLNGTAAPCGKVQCILSTVYANKRKLGT